MADVFNAQVVGFDGKNWEWMCGNQSCCARTNPPVAIKGMQRVKTRCSKCGSINTVSRFR